MDREELTIVREGEEETIPLHGRFAVGSGPDSDLVVEDVDTTQFVIESARAGTILKVQAKADHGVAINGAAASEEWPLSPGDEITLGGVRIVYRAPSPRRPTAKFHRDALRGAQKPRDGYSMVSDTQELSWFSSESIQHRSLLALYQISKLFSTTSSENELLEATLQEAMRGLMANEGAVVVRAPSGELVELFTRGAPAFDEAQLLQAVEQGVASSSADDGDRPSLIVPIVQSGAQPEGALCFTRNVVPRAFVKEEVELASSLGRMLAVGLERVRLLKDLRSNSLALSRVKRQLDAVLGTISEGLVLVTWEGKIGLLSSRGEQLLAKVGGWDPSSREPLAADSPLAPLVARALLGKPVVGEDVDAGDAVIEVSGQRVAALDAAVLVLRDVTRERRREREHRETEERLRREILAVSTREQGRIGQDLHDGLCQTLVGVRLVARLLHDALQSQGRPEAADADRIQKTLNDAVTSARGLARGLFPVALEAHGLEAALEELTTSTEKLFGVPCVFECEQPVLVHDNLIATHLYYVAREAVTNAIKHGEPNGVWVRLERRGGWVALSIRDDGQGIQERGPSEGMGLHIMRHRAQTIGAELSIEGRARQGTTVTVELKVDAE